MRQSFTIVDRSGEFYRAIGTTNNGQHILFATGDENIGQFVSWMRTSNYRFVTQQGDDEHRHTVLAIKVETAAIVQLEQEIDALKSEIRAREERVAELVNTLPAVISPSEGTRMTKSEWNAVDRETRRTVKGSATPVKLPKREVL
jgi:hypothetical protein